jgi:hypothetical protein
MNHMYINKSTTCRQQHGIIVSLPKNDGDITPAGYCPISLMNTDYKLLARIMAQRLTPVPEEQLTSSQYCSVPGRSILEAVSVPRDFVAHAEITRTPVCILSLDFRNAFDRISHRYWIWNKRMVYRPHSLHVQTRHRIHTDKWRFDRAYSYSKCSKTGMSA